MPLTQERRLLTVATPLGKDVLLLAAFSGQEEMSRLFAYHLELLSEKESIDPKDIVGKVVTWAVRRHDRPPRFFNGVVRRFSAATLGTRGTRVYKAEVVPWLWLLTRTANCRIFQNKSIPEIIEQVFKDFGFKDYERSLGGSHPKWEYCVQYRETAFDFVSRLMEHEGIFYYFRHEEGKHILVLGDQASACKDLPEKEVVFSAGALLTDHVVAWEHRYEFRTGKHTQTDYNFETPTTKLETSSKTVVKLTGNAQYEVFDYPGEYEKKDDGAADTKLRMEEDERAYDVVEGKSLCTTFNAGGKFKLKEHNCPAEKGNYLITSIRHTATDPSYAKEVGVSEEYSNTFTCIPATVPFRPERRTPKAVVGGPQTAVVVGLKGEEIYTDKYGRVKVQFFWDREGKRDEKSSCWIRVAQVWAGRRWGASFWPRIGQEVVVEFLEGDPDRPLVTGLVYNADQMPPYLGEGPDGKHSNDNKVAGLKSNTTLGGAGFNEVRFDDTKDKQQVFLHAERNMDERIKNDRMELVLHNRHLIVGDQKTKSDAGDQVERIWRDKHLNVKRHQAEKIEGNLQLTVGKGDAAGGGNVDIVIEKDKAELIEKDHHCHVKGKRADKVDGDQSLTVGGAQKEKIGADHGLEVSGNRSEKVGGNQSLTVGGNQHEKVSVNHALEAGAMIHIKAGATLVLEAGAQLTLKVGGNFIDINPGAIAIQGTAVLINSGGGPGAGPGASPQSPAAPDAPKDAKPAAPADPVVADNAVSGTKSA
jgi:type VI secretion system secreted protein VgrG